MYVLLIGRAKERLSVKAGLAQWDALETVKLHVTDQNDPTFEQLFGIANNALQQSGIGIKFYVWVDSESLGWWEVSRLIKLF